jgi:hypothetical protein
LSQEGTSTSLFEIYTKNGYRVSKRNNFIYLLDKKNFKNGENTVNVMYVSYWTALGPGKARVKLKNSLYPSSLKAGFPRFRNH